MSTPANAIDLQEVGVVSFSGTAFSASGVSEHFVIVGGASNALTSVTPSTAGFVLTSNGVSSDPSFKSPSLVLNYTNVNAAASPYTVLSTDYYLSVDSSAGAVTLLFPNAPTAKQTWVVKDRTGNAFTNNITIRSVSGAILFDGASSYVLQTNYQAIDMLANATPTYEIF